MSRVAANGIRIQLALWVYLYSVPDLWILKIQDIIDIVGIQYTAVFAQCHNYTEQCVDNRKIVKLRPQEYCWLDHIYGTQLGFIFG